MHKPNFARKLRILACGEAGWNWVVDGDQIPIVAGCKPDDAGALMTLHNKILRPAWLPHNTEIAYLGCTRCALECPILRCMCNIDRDAGETKDAGEKLLAFGHIGALP
jgi:hypothetical protein